MNERSSEGHTERTRGPAAVGGSRRARRLTAFSAALAVTLLGLALALLWPTGSGNSPGGIAPGVAADRIDVVCFHRTQRCDSCLWAGQTAKWTIETYFAVELARGRVTFREVDVQSADNAGLARLYGASGSSLYVNFVQHGEDHIAQATETYPYIGNRDRFAALLRARIASGLEAPR